MTNKEILINEIAQLPESIVLEVLHYVQFLKVKVDKKTISGVEGKPADYLLEFAGAIEQEDLEIMEKAIEEDCERIDPSEW